MNSDTIAVASFVTSALLALLTGFYVYLTRQLVMETRRASAESQRILSAQLRMTLFPKITCRVSFARGKFTLDLMNLSDYPAYDVDAHFASAYHDDELPLSDFLKKHVQDTFEANRISLYDGAFYGVYDRCVYFDFPPKRKVSVHLDYPAPPQCCYFLRSTDPLVLCRREDFELTRSEDKYGSYVYSLEFRMRYGSRFRMKLHGWIPFALGSHDEKIGWIRIVAERTEKRSDRYSDESDHGDKEPNDWWLSGTVAAKTDGVVSLLALAFEAE